MKYDDYNKWLITAYRLLIGKNIETVVLVCLSHKYNLKETVVYSRGSFLIPLSNIEIDEQMASEIMDQAWLYALSPLGRTLFRSTVTYLSQWWFHY